LRVASAAYDRARGMAIRGEWTGKKWRLHTAQKRIFNRQDAKHAKKGLNKCLLTVKRGSAYNPVEF